MSTGIGLHTSLSSQMPRQTQEHHVLSGQQMGAEGIKTKYELNFGSLFRRHY